MRLIVLIRSFNPRRTQFILQNIETRGKSFNPRAHTGRDTRRECNSSCVLLGFNPRAHTGRDTPRSMGTPRSTGFNPRAHTGRDAFNVPNSFVYGVSIHAPTRGATKKATPVEKSKKFQSTRPPGARHPLVADTALSFCVSIHAPTRGATPNARARISVLYVSIHAPTRGAT